MQHENFVGVEPIEFRRRGVSLIELVTVLMALGVFSAMTAPATNTRLNSPRLKTAKNLQRIRDAITFYQAEHGHFPMASELTTQVEQIWNRPFPKCSVGNTNSEIRIESNAKESNIGVEGWSYNPKSGQFWVNSTKYESM